LMSQNVPKAIEKISEACKAGIVSDETLSHSVKKILMAKYKVGLNNYATVKIQDLEKDLFTIHDKVLFEELVENSITVVKNDMGILPVKDIATKKIAYVSFGDAAGEPFLRQLRKYGKVDHVKADRLDIMMEKLKDYNLVIIGFH